jgi:hypothetical protein
MPSTNAVGVALLSTLFVAGFYTTWGLALQNGLLDTMEEISSAKSPVLPGTKAALNTKITGIKPVDNQLTILGLFAWQFVSGEAPALSIFTLGFGGQLVALLGIQLLESFRVGNAWKAVSLYVLPSSMLVSVSPN